MKTKEMIQAAIQDVEEREGAKSIYGVVHTDKGRFTCFDVKLCEELAEKAIGKVMDLEVEFNGQFKNLLMAYPTDKLPAALSQNPERPNAGSYDPKGARIGCAFNNATRIWIATYTKQGSAGDTPVSVQIGNLAKELLAAMKTVERDDQ